MAQQRRANCQICKERESKYVCPKCEVLYCSISCFKEHKSSSCSAGAGAKNGANTAIVSTSARADGKRTAIGNAPIKSITPAGPAEDEESRKRQPSLLVSDGNGAGASPPHFQPRPASVPVFGTSTHVPPESGAVPSTDTTLTSHPSQGDPRSGGAGDIDVDAEADDAKLERKRNTMNVQKQITEAEGDVTSPADEISPRPASDSSPDPESILPREASPNSSTIPVPHRPLRKLSSLKWPYVPDMPSYPDPLTRDDPKPLSLAQYEAMARSPAIRHVLASHSRLPELLRKVDTLRGDARERAIERVLGVAPDQASFALAGLPPSSELASLSTGTPAAQGRREGLPEVDKEDMRALRELAEAVEAAVRSTNDPGAGFGTDSLGLDWESMEG